MKVEKYERILHMLEGHLTAVGPVDPNYMLQLIRDVLSPPVETEEVTVERWTWGGGSTTWATQKEAERGVPAGQEVYKLTGTYTRPKPQPVERSVSVEAYIDHEGDVADKKGGYACSPFGGYAECHGKVVTLTATWLEEPK